MKVAVSIVNFNTQELTMDCIRSILKKKWKNEVEVWVIDNASTDGSLEHLETVDIKLIANKANEGFAKGHNVALKKIKADYILILNSDTIMGQGVIDKMVDFMDSHPQVGISSCKVLGFDGKLQPNGGDLPFGASLFNWLYNMESFGIKKPSFHRMEEDYYQSPHQVGWVSGNFMMIRSTLIDKIGYLDEDYFMYFEDVDYCLKAQRAGFTVYLNPEVSIKHLSGGSADDPRYRQWQGELRGLIKFYKKQYGLLSSLVITVMVYLALILRIVGFAIKGNFNYSLTYGKIIANLQ